MDSLNLLPWFTKNEAQSREQYVYICIKKVVYQQKEDISQTILEENLYMVKNN